MTAPARLSLFAILLVAVFAGAALLGGAVDPSGSDAGEGHAAEVDAASAEHGADHGGAGETLKETPPGLAVALFVEDLGNGHRRFVWVFWKDQGMPHGAPAEG